MSSRCLIHHSLIADICGFHLTDGTSGIFSTLADEAAIAKERDCAQSNSCSHALAAASMVLSDIPKLDQAVLSKGAVKKLVAAHCECSPTYRLCPAKPLTRNVVRFSSWTKPLEGH